MYAALRRLRDARFLSGPVPGRVVVRVGVMLRLLWTLALLCTAPLAQSAYLIQGATPATLSWSGATAAVQADVG